MTSVLEPDTTDERGQVERARRGDRAAFWTLYDAHAAAAWRLALAVRPDRDVAGAAVADAFAKVLGPVDRRAHAHEVPLRLLLLAATRDAIVITADGRGPAFLMDEAPATASGSVLAAPADRAARAFDRLPERWRTVLWLTHVEHVTPGDAAVVLGISAATTNQLADRAQAGLREQFAQDQVVAATLPGCQRTVVRLGSYVSGTLSSRDAIRVRRHLDSCEVCRGRLEELDDLAPRLRRAVPVLPLVVGTAAEEAWALSTARAAGPLGLTLPGGRPLPMWAERALTGATAAIVTLGITGAVLAGARGGGRDSNDEGPLARRTEQPLGAADGESALGGTGDAGGTPESGTADPPAPTDDQPSRGRRGSFAGTDAGASPSPGTGAPPAGPSTPTAPPSVQPTTPGPTTPPSEPPTGTPPVVVRVDDGTAISLGGDCTGVEVLGIVIGCDPPATDDEPLLPPLLGGLGGLGL